MTDQKRSGHQENHPNVENLSPKTKVGSLLLPKRVDLQQRRMENQIARAQRNRPWRKNQTESKPLMKLKVANKKLRQQKQWPRRLKKEIIF